MDELYSEILYETLHFRGCDADLNRLALLEYLQKAFEVDDVTHSHLLEVAKLRKAPKFLLNVEVLEATILKPSIANGLSDLFCTLYLASSTTVHYNTSVKPGTLKPIWKEEYQLSVENSAVDALCVELWKMKKIKKVKGVKSLSKILKKEVSSLESAGKHDNKLIGRGSIPLKDIPAVGQIVSSSINKNGKMKKQGDVELHLTFHFKKNTKAALKEHMHLIKNVILHEIKMSQVEPHSWTGSLSKLAEKILIQHHVQSGLSLVSGTLAQWIEFSNIHTLHPLSFTVFLPLLQKLSQSIQEGLVTEEEKKMFWKATVLLLPSCLSGIRNIQVLTSSEKTISEPSIILRILTLLQELEPPRDIILFPIPIYGWLQGKKSTNYSDICTAVIETATQGAEEWFSKVTEEHDINDVNDEEEKIKRLLNVVVTVTMSLQKAIDLHDTSFQEYFHFPYADTLYKLYDVKFSEIIETTVEGIWKCMSPLKFKDNTEKGIYDNDPLALSSVLFELYINLQKFYRLGHKKCQDGLDFNLPNKFHEWFRPGIIHWLCVSQYKALHRIQTAVQLDNFVPVYTDTKYTTSACDILEIFDQIRISWKDLAWPNANDCKEFVEKITGDICECLIFYADQMCQKVEELYKGENVNDKEIQGWCLAVTNMDHVQLSVHSILCTFGVDKIITTDNETTCSTSENCRHTLKAVIDNTIESARNKIREAAVQKMMPLTSKILMEAFQNLDSEEKIGKLMSHVDFNLCTLHSHLDSSNFNCLLSIIWKKLYCKLHEVLEISMKLQRKQSFFKKAHDVIQKLAEYFKMLNESIDLSNLTDLEQLLQVHEMDTWELVHQCRMEQLVNQKAMQTASQGLLTVRMLFMEEILKIEILNARNLQPISSKGCCYPYVKIYLLPEIKFLGVVQPRTRTQKNTVFPLFEETFVIQLSPTQLNVKDAMVMFMVKEKTFLRRNRYLGETLVSFDDIPKYDGSTKFEHLEQMHLKLSLPTKLDSGAFVILEHYQEELAREFIKNRKLQKCHNKAARSIHAFSADTWGSVVNVMSYVSKGPLHINFLQFIPCTGAVNNSVKQNSCHIPNSSCRKIVCARACTHV